VIVLACVLQRFANTCIHTVHVASIWGSSSDSLEDGSVPMGSTGEDPVGGLGTRSWISLQTLSIQIMTAEMIKNSKFCGIHLMLVNNKVSWWGGQATFWRLSSMRCHWQWYADVSIHKYSCGIEQSIKTRRTCLAGLSAKTHRTESFNRLSDLRKRAILHHVYSWRCTQANRHTDRHGGR